MDNKIFLWLHMHQPDYQESITNKIILPWVRRHSLNGYYSVPKLLKDSSFKANINFSGILLEQLKRYIDGEKDYFQILEEKDPEYLSPSEKQFIFLKFNVPITFKNETFLKLKEKIKYREKLTNSEILDYQTIFKLSAFSPLDEEVIELRKKGSNFTKDDKKTLINLETRIIRELFGLYIGLLKRKQIEITVTPFHHPILPLLLDINSAKKSKETAIVPDIVTGFINDANWHIKQSIKIAEEIFGITPQGMWPAEGSISDETIDLLKENGIKWIGSDELLVKPFNLSQGIYSYKDMTLFLRNHSVSDKIGFVYNKMKPPEAINDLKNEAKMNKKLILILDGENPWEYFPDYGIDFLKSFFGSFKETDTLLGSEGVASVKLSNIKPGSWINGYFDTWVGDEESNTAWMHLTEVRNEVSKNDLLNEIYRAEASDYFWWYSDFHKNEVGFEFDSLFRSRLIKSLLLEGKEVKDFLLFPIKRR
ncbi:MAG: hypothetical protein K6343_03810 [Caldisericaceae bacterium]